MSPARAIRNVHRALPHIHTIEAAAQVGWDTLLSKRGVGLHTLKALHDEAVKMKLPHLRWAGHPMCRCEVRP